MSIACSLFGLWCAAQTSLGFSGFDYIGQRALNDITRSVNFSWEMPCPKSDNVDYGPYMRATAEMLNPMQDALPLFLHGMVPNFLLRGNTIMQFSSPAPCVYNISGDLTTSSTLNFSELVGAVDIHDSVITVSK